MIEQSRECGMDRFPLFFIALVGTVVILLGGLVAYAIKDAQAWRVYAEEHDCHKTGESVTSTHTNMIMSGKVMVPHVYTITRYEWKCETPEEIVWR